MIRSNRLLSQGIKMPDYEQAPKQLQELMDRFYITFCVPLSRGSEGHILIENTPLNRLLIKEFSENYLPQRANLEGWEYDPSKLNVRFTKHTNQISHTPIKLYPSPLLTPEGDIYGVELVADDRWRIIPMKEAQAAIRRAEGIVGKLT